MGVKRELKKIFFICVYGGYLEKSIIFNYICYLCEYCGLWVFCFLKRLVEEFIRNDVKINVCVKKIK